MNLRQYIDDLNNAFDAEDKLKPDQELDKEYRLVTLIITVIPVVITIIQLFIPKLPTTKVKNIERCMSYKLVLSQHVNGTIRDIGENVFLDNLPEDYKVFLFYYPSAMLNVELENNLRSIGKLAGKNLFVNIGRLNDTKYTKIRNTFEIRELPVIVLTGIDALACIKHDGDYSTAYIRIDSKKLLSSVELTVKWVLLS